MNIGIALITDPRVLFLDEPTSGLDSYTANEVMTVVKGLVADGTTICATIHSPTPLTFSLFDRVILLVRGELVFFGKRRKNKLASNPLNEILFAQMKQHRISKLSPPRARLSPSMKQSG